METAEIKNKTVFGIFWRLSERVLAQLISFIVSIVLARILMPEEYGVVALMLVFINIFNAFVTNGMGTSLIQKKNADTLDFSTMFYTGIVLSIILYFLLFFLSPTIAKLYKNLNLVILLRVMGIKLPIAAISSIQQAYVSKRMEYKKFFYSTLIGTIVSGILGIVAAILGMGVWALVIQYLTNSIMDTIVLFITVKWRPTLEFSFKRFKGLFSYGYKIMLSGAIGTIFDQLKNFIIGIRYTATDLAYYNRGEQIPSLAYNNINAALESVLFSTVSQIQEDKAIVKNALRKMINNINYIIMPLMFGIAIIAKPFIRIVLTDKWLPCVPFLVVVCIQQCFGVIGNIHLQTVKAIGRSDIILKLEAIKKPLFIISILIGMQISPLAIVIANCIYGFIALGINANPNRRILKYTIKEQINDILPTFIISSIMVLVCYLIGMLKLPIFVILVLQILIGMITYLLLSIIFKNKAFYSIVNYIRYSKIGTILKGYLANIFGSKLFRIKKNKIVFDNFSGKGYGCNPKYIAEEIIRQKLNYDLVWLVNDLNEEMPPEVRKVRKGSIKSLYELATAKVWIDNVRNFKGVKKKKEQYYIQTWHGGIGLKGVEGDVEDKLSEDYVKEAKNDGKICDLMITNNNDNYKYIKEYFWYDGEVLCKGLPRCDIIYKNDSNIYDKVYNYFKIDKNTKIVLYAPTFRKDLNLDVYMFNYKKCLEVLQKKFKNNYVMLIRLHPNIENSSDFIKYDNQVLNATKYSDIQELIAVSSIVITDYSSVSFEAALVYKPVFLYTKDLNEYIEKERKLTYNIKELPFEFSTNEEELYENINNFNDKKYKKECDMFYKKIGIVHNSESAKEIVNIIKDKINN